MKYKSCLIGLLPIIPFVAVILMEAQKTPIQAFSLWQYLIALIVLAASTYYVWRRYIGKPIEDFVQSLNRAIHGDYQARFSCEPKNRFFSPISQLFNQFMGMIEQQMDEVSRTRHLQTQLYENEKIYRSALELTCERIFEADLAHNRLIYGQEQYNHCFSFLKTELYDEIVKSIAEHAIVEEDAQLYRNTLLRENLLKKFKSGEIKEINLEYRQKVADGKIQWRMATVIHLSNSGDESVKVIGYIKDIDTRKRNELEIIKLSQKDGLTGLYNKKFTQSLCEEYLSGEDIRSKNAAIMLDVDNFKNINDTLGHVEGDAALEKVSAALQNVFRSTDILGRIGGDEFFILIKNYATNSALISKLNLLLKSLDEIQLGPKKDFSLSASIGVSLYPEDGSTYTELYLKADTSLYHAKQHGKNRYYICGGHFPENKSERVRIGEEI